LKILLSFDIDGTLETGDPPGPITLEMVKRAKELGCIIGSASDRSVTAQNSMWARAGIEVDFTANKHLLIGVKERFEADYYLHMGDRDLDKQFAREAEFEFMWMTEAASEPWIAMANGTAPAESDGTVSASSSSEDGTAKPGSDKFPPAAGTPDSGVPGASL
jgi:hypothetical protein